MDAAGHPEASRLERQRMIQIESDHSGATLRCQTDDLDAVRTPPKMFVPFIASRMEQSNSPAGVLIARELLLAFELIAERTTQTKVFKFGGSTCRSWPDVVKMKSCHRHLLRGLTVFAAVVGRANRLLAEFS